jgi:hypothetical protein
MVAHLDSAFELDNTFHILVGIVVKGELIC